MPDNWIQLLPKGVTRPIVINLVFPETWRKKDGHHTAEDKASQGEAIALVKNKQYISERDAITKQYGADHVTVLSNPTKTTDPNVVATVYFPKPLTTKNPNEAAQSVMQWFEASLLGKIYFKQGKQNRMSQVVTSGQTYDKVDSLKDLKPNVDSDDYTHSVDHCVCH